MFLSASFPNLSGMRALMEAKWPSQRSGIVAIRVIRTLTVLTLHRQWCWCGVQMSYQSWSGRSTTFSHGFATRSRSLSTHHVGRIFPHELEDDREENEGAGTISPSARDNAVAREDASTAGESCSEGVVQLPRVSRVVRIASSMAMPYSPRMMQ